jgi:quercetin dioxygenase-like cupin family protein
MRAAVTAEPRALALGEGDAFWFIDNLATVKVASGQTEGRLAVLEIAAPHGHMPPLHVHPMDDEVFYMLDGEATYYVGDRSFKCTDGATVFAPRAVPHTFRVESDSARWLVITAPGGFDSFVTAIGVPARTRTLPRTPRPFQPEGAAGIDYKVEILGPPGTLP